MKTVVKVVFVLLGLGATIGAGYWFYKAPERAQVELARIQAQIAKEAEAQAFRATQVKAQAEAARLEKLIEQAKSSILATMKDPQSTQWQDVRVYENTPNARITVCGRVNSKNSYGGYTGFSRFTWNPDRPDGAMVENISPVTENDKLIGQLFDGLYKSFCVSKSATS